MVAGQTHNEPFPCRGAARCACSFDMRYIDLPGRIRTRLLLEETFFDALFTGFQNGIDYFFLFCRHGAVTEFPF